MTLDLRLLGPPRATVDGVPVRLRGTKPWALLAYLLRCDGPVPRRRLTRLLFVDAADPDGALRWNLSELRRTLGVRLDGDPLTLTLPPDTVVDLDVLASRPAEDALAVEAIDDGFLAGLVVDADGAFDVWLDDQRRHVAKLVGDVLREGAVAALGRGDHDRAIEVARRAVRSAPLDEPAAALLVRALSAAGRTSEAHAVAADTDARLRRDLGVEPAGLLRRALAPAPGGDPLASGRAVVTAQLEAGRAAIAAGAVDAGLGALRSATVAARATGDRALLARALVTLGRVLIHAVRDVDDGATALLHEAGALAEGVGDAPLVATAYRELGYVDLLFGRYERSWAWFARARAASDGPRESGWAEVYEATGRDDVGDPTALAHVEAALQIARETNDARLRAYAHVILGRHVLAAGDHDRAGAVLETAIALARRADWVGLVPFPEALLAEAQRRVHRLDRARVLAEHAVALARQVSDPCYETGALRTLALVDVDDGAVDRGLGVLADLPGFCRRNPGTYVWIQAWTLDALADVTTARGRDDGGRWVAALRDVAAATGMRPFLRSAAAYHERLREVPAGQGTRR